MKGHTLGFVYCVGGRVGSLSAMLNREGPIPRHSHTYKPKYVRVFTYLHQMRPRKG